MKRIALIVAALLFASAAPARATQGAFEDFQYNHSGDVVTSTVTPTIAPACQAWSGADGRMVDGFGDFTVTAGAYKDAGNIRLFERRFLVNIVGGVMSVTASKSDDGPSVGWGLLFANVGLQPNPSDPLRSVCVTVTGVYGATVYWHARINGYFYSSN
jgi:hypothetical protein